MAFAQTAVAYRPTFSVGKAVKVSQPKGLAEVTFDASKTNREAIAKSITDKTGFKAEVYGTRK